MILCSNAKPEFEFSFSQQQRQLLSFNHTGIMLLPFSIRRITGIILFLFSIAALVIQSIVQFCFVFFGALCLSRQENVAALVSFTASVVYLCTILFRWVVMCIFTHVMYVHICIIYWGHNLSHVKCCLKLHYSLIGQINELTSRPMCSNMKSSFVNCHLSLGQKFIHELSRR